MTVIKRYTNRKLYNTETKQYITLDELADLIRTGEDIHVVDNASGEDLTVLTLTQILLEQARKQAGFLPRTLLAGMIQAGGQRLFTLQRTLATSIGLRNPVDEEIDRRIRALIDSGEIPEEEGLRLRDKLLAQSEAPRQEKPPLDRQAVEQIMSEHGVATRSELQRLLHQIDSLTSSIDQLASSEDSTKTPPGHDDQS